MSSNSSDLLNPHEAARYLRISISTLRRLRLAGRLSNIRLSPKLIRYRVGDLEKFRDSHLHKANAQRRV